MDKGQQREEKKQRFTMIAGLVGAMAGRASVATDVERLSLSLSAAEVAQIDLLIDQGFYSSRAEFLEAATRNQLATHVPAAHSETANRVMVLGVVIHSRHTLEKLRAAGRKLDLRVTGLLRLTEDIPPELALDVIQSLKVSGSFVASAAVKAALRERMT